MVSRILDATSFYAGIPFSSPEVSYTTPQVFDEIKHIKKSQDAITALVDTGRLRVVEPEEKFVQMVLKKSQETGDYQQLSDGDVSVLALCLQLGGELLTDDFAASNVAKHMGLKVLPIMTRGAEKRNWTYFCPGCSASFSKLSVCPTCGSRLVRRQSARNISKKK